MSAVHNTRLRTFSGCRRPTVSFATPITPHSNRLNQCRQVKVLCQTALDSDTSIAELELELRAALKKEDYKRAARLRDAIQQKQQVGKLAVEDANRKFYDAFMSGRIEEMAKIVGEGEHVQVVHPGASCVAGREQVMESWRAIMRNVRPGAFKVVLEDVRVHAREDMGFVTCVEVIDADDSQGRIMATNVFEKQDGVWRIVQHHGSPYVARYR